MTKEELMPEIIFKPNPKFNILPSPKKDTDWHYSQIVKSIGALPEKVDLSEYLAPVKDQGEWGFCHSYSAASMKEAQEYAETNCRYIFSPLHLAKVIKERDGITDTEGTTMINVCKRLCDTGVIEESLYPSEGYVTNSFEFKPFDDSKIVHYKTKNYARCDNLSDIKKALADGKFVLLGIQALSTIYELNKGIEVLPFDANGKMIIIGGHQILIYGYDKDYLYALNSWGEKCGKNGKFKIPNEYITFRTKDMGFSLLMDAYSFVDLENDPLVGDKIELTVGSKTVYVNGEPIVLDAAPFINPETERCLVPIRFISETLGYNVKWNNSNRKVLITKGNESIHLWVGKDHAIVNGYKKTLDQSPVIRNDRTFVPVRLVTEALGCSCLWDGRLNKITILKQ